MPCEQSLGIQDWLSFHGRRLFQQAFNQPPIFTTVLVPDGTEYTLGELESSTTILQVKQKLAEVGPFRYLVE